MADGLTAFSEHGAEIPEDQKYNPRKMFVGGLGPQITPRSLTEYFSKYGEVAEASVVLDRMTGRSRGFGFVIFKDLESVDKCSQKLRHIIENVNCEVRKAVPREDARQQSELGARCKVFVSGLGDATRENHLREYFEAFGPVEEANIKTDRTTGRSRGFAFVLFKTPEAARQSLGPHPELGPSVEAKIAEPRVNYAAARPAAAAAAAPPPAFLKPPKEPPAPAAAAAWRKPYLPPYAAAPPYAAPSPYAAPATPYAPYPHLGPAAEEPTDYENSWTSYDVSHIYEVTNVDETSAAYAPSRHRRMTQRQRFSPY